jgi:hypothetical protein
MIAHIIGNGPSKVHFKNVPEGKVFGCNFACKKHHLDALVLSNILSQENLPFDKHGSIAWERIFSVGLRHLQFTCKFLLSRYHSFDCFAFRKHFFNRQ